MKMQKDTLITAMKNSISDVLETMFFLPLDFSDAVGIDNQWDADLNNILAAQLNFGGPFGGYAVFGIPRSLALSMTADFLGSDEKDISDGQVKETVQEIINMIIGNTFSMYDSEAVFNLEIPELVSSDKCLANSSDSENEIFIKIETPENDLALLMVIEM